MSSSKTHVKKGDTVEVIAGNHKGSTGTILQVITGKNQVLVEGVRMITKHQKRNAAYPEGGLISKEGPIHISNVKLATVEKPAAKKKSTRKAKAKD